MKNNNDLDFFDTKIAEYYEKASNQKDKKEEKWNGKMLLHYQVVKHLIGNTSANK